MGIVAAQNSGLASHDSGGSRVYFFDANQPVSIGQATLFLDGVQQVDEVELTLERAIRA